MFQRESIPWLAGLLEGEGCFDLADKKNPNSIRVRLTMTDKDVVETAYFATGIGRKPRPARKEYHPRHKEAWTAQWKGPRAAELMRLIRPWMGTRRAEKIDKLLEGYRP